MKTVPRCCKCGVDLTPDNWHASLQKLRNYICKTCFNNRRKAWRKANPEKNRATYTRSNRKLGSRPFTENRGCSSFLGVHVAERVLGHVFKDVEQMPHNHPGYDFICNTWAKIDVKSSCLRKDNGWNFNIKRNHEADYFLCLAFDNRKDLNPLYIWLIPGSKVSHHTSIGICPNTAMKWEEYELDVSNVSTCCNAIKEGEKN